MVLVDALLSMNNVGPVGDLGDTTMLLKLDGSGPLSLQVYQALRGAILQGTLPPGARLPSSRTLAREMSLSRNTVLLAYEQLLGEGYAAGRHGSGTYVAAELPPDVASLMRPEGNAAADSRRSAPHLSRFARTTRGWQVTWAAPETRAPYDFRYGGPGLDFPHATWRRLLGRRLRKVSRRDLDYGSPAGSSELRAAVADYLQRSRGVRCHTEQVVIVRGSQQALDLAVRVLLDPGDAVLIEEPSYPGARAVFAAAGARLITAPVGADGMDIGARAAAPRARLAYVTPSHQFPTGAIMSVARRLALLGWAEHARAHVIEDDYDSEYRYIGRPIEALQGLDRSGRVIYVGTFSKLLFPALRLGYVVLPEPLVKPFLIAKALGDTGGAAIEQLALADFIRDGHFERHIRRSRLRNGARRVALLAAIERYLGDRVEVSGANAGLHVLLWLRQRPSRQHDILGRIEAAGVRVYPVARFYLSAPKRPGFLLGYASLTESEITEGIRRLATAI
jgi:GntR family transcriptional regulator/MocR family aminotransferase